MKNGTSSTNDDTITDRYTRRDEHISRDPNLVAYRNWTGIDREIEAAIIMCRSADIRPLGNHGISTDTDVTQGIEHNLVTNPRIVADRDFPGIGNPGCWTNQDMLAYMRTEEPKQHPPADVQRLWGRLEQKPLNELPELYDYRRASSEIGRKDKTTEILKLVHG